MPAALAGRGQGSDVVVRSASHADTFTLGLRSFINEARLLARFDHPSLVKVYRFWEEHGTAYMVMPFYRGQTLQQVRREMSAPPDEAWLRRLITPLLGALECLHKENVFHRDVAPDNILLLDDENGPGMGLPVLLDLGAARRVIGGQTHALTAIVKPSFAPIEQYAETVQLRQGPWTDLYALAAVVHFCITGRPPMPATARTVHDELATLRQMSASLASGFNCQFSEPFIHAIDHALLVRPQDRPDSVAAWRAELSGIVSERTGSGADAPIDAKSPEWMAHTVLVRSEGTEKPPGHQAIEAQSFMTTIPAANRLNAPPAWPDNGASTAVPTTIPLSPPASKGLDLDELASTGTHSKIWLKWVFLALTLTLVMALWWTQHRANNKVRATTFDDVASLDKRLAAQPRAPEATQPAADAKKPVAQPASAASRPRHRLRQDEQSAKKEESTATAEAVEPLNPRKACGNKVFIWLAICMKRHCSRPEYAEHPECERMRQQEAAQRSNN